MTWLLRAGVLMAVVGGAGTMMASLPVDRTYDTRVPRTFGRPAPRVVIDQAHFNVHTMDDGLVPLANLLYFDGYRVDPFSGPFSAESLQGFDVLVIVNAFGLGGLVQHGANLLGFERRLDLDVGAFAPDEVRAVETWVRGGGRLLLVADHAPAGEAAADLAAAFGVRMHNWWVADTGHTDPTARNPGYLRFSAADGLLVDTPIARGRTIDERVRVVATFTGQALEAPPEALTLLRLSDTAREYPYRPAREEEGRSAAGLAQAVALTHGAGRVVIAGEAAAFTAQYAEMPSGERLLYGMNREGNDNRQFVLNVMHWLAGILN